MPFTRRSFLGSLAALLAARPAWAAPAAPRRPFLSLAIAGTAHHGYDSVAAALRVGERLVLRREPANRHDPNAVEIVTEGGVKLGYVPRAAARDLAPRLDAGERIGAEIASFLPIPARGERFAIPDGLVRTWARPGEPVVALLA